MDAVHASIEFGLGGPWLAEYTLDALGAGVVMFDASARVSQWSAAAAVLFGVTEQQLAGRSLDDDGLGLVRADLQPLTASDDPVRAVLMTGRPENDVILGRPTGHGDMSWNSISLLPVFGADREPRGVLASIVNVDDQIDSRASSNRWQRLAHSMLRADMTAGLVVDRRGAIVEWNDRALVLSGRSEVEMIGSELSDICDIDLEWVWEHARASETGSIDGVTFVLPYGGAEISVPSRFTLASWPGVGDALLIQLLDPAWFPERDQSSSSSTSSLELHVFEQVQVPLCLITEHGVIFDVNQTAASLFGQPRSELAAQPVTQHLLGLSWDHLRRNIELARATSAPVPVGSYLTIGSGPELAEFDVSIASMSCGDAPPASFLLQLTERVDGSGSDTRTRPRNGNNSA